MSGFARENMSVKALCKGYRTHPMCQVLGAGELTAGNRELKVREESSILREGQDPKSKGEGEQDCLCLGRRGSQQSYCTCATYPVLPEWNPPSSPERWASQGLGWDWKMDPRTCALFPVPLGPHM